MNAEECLKINLIDDIYPQQGDYNKMATSFFIPFLAQKYPNAVKDIKEAIANIDDGTQGDLLRTSERQLFVKRWCSTDNLDALLKK